MYRNIASKYGFKYFTFLVYLGYIENQLYGQNFFNNHWCLVPFITNLIDTTRPKCMQNLSCIPSRYVTFLFISSLQSYSAQRSPISKTLSINAYVSKYHFMPNNSSQIFTILMLLFQYQNIN